MQKVLGGIGGFAAGIALGLIPAANGMLLLLLILPLGSIISGGICGRRWRSGGRWHSG